MITEVAVFNIVEEAETRYLIAFVQAEKIIRSMKSYISHELIKCIEEKNKFLLIVRWQTLEDHIEGFRKHEKYKEWKKLLHHFYNPFPTVGHYETI